MKILATMTMMVLAFAACSDDAGEDAETSGDQIIAGADGTTTTSTVGETTVNELASPDTVEPDENETDDDSTTTQGTVSTSTTAAESSETTETISTTIPATTSSPSASQATTTSAATTTIVTLRIADVQVTARGETKSTKDSVSFEIDSTKGVDFSFQATNGASMRLASVEPASKCAVDGDRFRFIEDAAKGGDVCVIGLEVAAIDGYDASTVVVNITGGSECYETYSIAWDRTAVQPNTEVSLTIDYDDGGTNCRTKIGCRWSNLVPDEYSGCWPDTATIAEDACANGAEQASFTVYSLSAGDNLFNDVPATAIWPLDCSE